MSRRTDFSRKLSCSSRSASITTGYARQLAGVWTGRMTGQSRRRERDRGALVFRPQNDRGIVDLFLDMHLADDDLLSRMTAHCYLPLVRRACAVCAPADGAGGGSGGDGRGIGADRAAHPAALAQAAIVVRGDAGFCRDTLMTWCEQRGVDYAEQSFAGPDSQAAAASGQGLRADRPGGTAFPGFPLPTLQSWGRQRRVVVVRQPHCFLHPIFAWLLGR